MSRNSQLFIWIWSLTVIKSGLFTNNDLIVPTRNGKVEGIYAVDSLRGVYRSFRGIPYAKPPVGGLRFQPSVPVDPWDDIKLAHNYSANCPQGGTSGEREDEDCLYVNVFVSMVSSKTPKPVMAYIHGGDYVEGAPTAKQLGPEHLMTKDIILVTFAYRLGVLGFAYFDDPELKMFGNDGLKDQVLALKWIKGNIHAFGGDTDRITLVGNSAGAFCAHLHLLSPLSRGLFSQVILQSGSGVYTSTPNVSGRRAAVLLNKNVPLNNDREAFDILNRSSAAEMYWMLSNQTDLGFDTVGPVVESVQSPNPFLTEEPLKIIEAGQFIDVPAIVGYNNEEGIGHFTGYGNYKVALDSAPGYYDYLFGVKDFVNSPVRDQLMDEMLEFYFGNGNYSKIYNYFHVMMDMKYFLAVHRTLQTQFSKAKSNVYVYRFSLDTEVNYCKFKKPELRPFKGASHADELGYLFKQTLYPEVRPGSDEERGIDLMLTMWTNFMETGDPSVSKTNSQTVFGNVTWPKAFSEMFRYLNIDLTPTVREGVFPENDRVEFWEKMRKREKVMPGWIVDDDIDNDDDIDDEDDSSWVVWLIGPFLLVLLAVVGLIVYKLHYDGYHSGYREI